MKIKVFPSSLRGSFNVPSSKSLTHRAIIAATLCDGISKIENVTFSNDVVETLNAIKNLGINFVLNKSTIKIFGNVDKLKFLAKNPKIIINCFQSASTLRFLMVFVAALGIKTTFLCSINLINRIKNCDDNFFYKISKNKIKIIKKLKPGFFYFKNCKTSQFITGLLLVMPILKKDSTIIFHDNLESMSYVNLTISFLKKLKIKINFSNNVLKIKGNQSYKAFNYCVEGDYSQAAFFGIAGCFNKIILNGLNLNSKQSDIKILKILKFCGTRIISNKNFIKIEPGNKKLEKFEFNLKNNPDLAPVLAVLASMCDGVSIIKNISRLANKESNRIISIFNMIKNLGGKIKINKNCFEIEGVNQFLGGQIDSFSDHRVVMAATVACIFSIKPIIINHCESVFKSYPTFFNHFEKLGGKLSVINLD